MVRSMFHVEKHMGVGIFQQIESIISSVKPQKSVNFRGVTLKIGT